MRDGEAWLLYRIGQALVKANHSVHIIMDSQAEFYQGGVCYWPAQRHPGRAAIYITTSRETPDVQADRTVGPDSLWDIMPGCELNGHVTKVPRRLIWTAHANRGLWHLMEMWPSLKAAVPGISLVVTHEVKRWCEEMKWTHDWQGIIARGLLDWFEASPEITLTKMVQRDEVNHYQGEAELLVYPCDPLYPNKAHHSLSALEAAGAGCALLLSGEERLYEDCEKAAGFLEDPWRHEDWVATAAEWLTNPSELKRRQGQAKEWAAQHTWAKFDQAWAEKVEALNV